ncbi:hypothetical protein [Dysgonomonas reticulitermitis]
MKVKILLVFLSLASVFTAEAKAKYYIRYGRMCCGWTGRGKELS